MTDPRISGAITSNTNRQAMNLGRQQTSSNNPGQITRSVGQMSNYGVARSANGQIQPGSIIKGEITDLRNNEITITLENNTVIKGEIQDTSNLSIGQTAAFRLQSSSTSGIQIETVPNTISDTELTMINKALDEAGMPHTEYNQSAVKALMDQLLPINKGSIQHLMQQAYDVGTKDLETICLMNRQNIEITADNVTQYSNYRNGQHQLLGRVQNFSEELPQLLSALSENGPTNAVTAFGQQLIGITLADYPGLTQSNASTETTSAVISSLPEEQLTELKLLLSETPMTDQQLQALQNGSMTQKEALTLLESASEQGTLQLPEEYSSSDTLQALKDIQTQLNLPSLSDNPLTTQVISDSESEILTDPLQADATESKDSSPANTSASLGQFFHNLSDAAKSSIQNLNQNINGMLNTQDNDKTSNSPAVLNTLLTNVSAQGKENNMLFTYLNPTERTQLANHLQLLSAPQELTDRILSGDISSKELLSVIDNIISQGNHDGPAASFFQSEVFQKLFSQTLLENFTVTPKELAKNGEMDTFFQHMEQKMDAFERLIQSNLSGSDSNQLSGQAHDMKQNIDFMKALNETMNYMQLPLRLQNQNAHGDLYVYTKKDKLKQNPEKMSLLLHLDMDHLGTMDIRLEKNQLNLNTTFTMSDPDSLALIDRNKELLENTLMEKGYQCRIQVQPLGKEENPVQNFLNTKVTTSGTFEKKRYSFDIRA